MSADDLAALSPAERDFALRRMPVDSLAESYRAANVEPADLGAPIPAAMIRRLDVQGSLIELRLLAHSLRNGGNKLHADELFRIVDEIREALK